MQLIQYVTELLMSHSAKLGSDWNKHHCNLGYTPLTCRVLQHEFPFGRGIERGNTQGNELPYCPFDVRRLTGCDKPRRQPRNLDTAILKLDKGPERKCDEVVVHVARRVRKDVVQDAETVWATLAYQRLRNRINVGTVLAKEHFAIHQVFDAESLYALQSLRPIALRADAALIEIGRAHV